MLRYAVGLASLLLIAQAQGAKPSEVDQDSTTARTELGPASTLNQKNHWYGTPIIAADILSVAGFYPASAIAIYDQGPAPQVRGVLILSSALLYATGGPIVHLAHGRYGIAAASLGMRVGMAVVGAMLGVGASSPYLSACTPQNDPCSDNLTVVLTGGLIGSAVGVGAASAIDAGLFAYEPNEAPGFSLSPLLDPKHNTAGLRLSGYW